MVPNWRVESFSAHGLADLVLIWQAGTDLGRDAPALHHLGGAETNLASGQECRTLDGSRRSMVCRCSGRRGRGGLRQSPRQGRVPVAAFVRRPLSGKRRQGLPLRYTR